MSAFISKSEAMDMTSRYRLQHETILNNLYQGQNLLPLSETFSKNDVDTLLAQTGCAGLRIYYGMDEDFKVHAILVGVNEADEDLLPQGLLPSTEEEMILERATRCPDICPPASDLNQ